MLSGLSNDCIMLSASAGQLCLAIPKGLDAQASWQDAAKTGVIVVIGR